MKLKPMKLKLIKLKLIKLKLIKLKLINLKLIKLKLIKLKGTSKMPISPTIMRRRPDVTALLSTRHQWALHQWTLVVFEVP
jgi:hypothetical protein